MGLTNCNRCNLGQTKPLIRPMLMAETFESLGLGGLESVGAFPWQCLSLLRLEVLKKLDIVHCRRSLAALEEDSCLLAKKNAMSI